MTFLEFYNDANYAFQPYEYKRDSKSIVSLDEEIFGDALDNETLINSTGTVVYDKDKLIAYILLEHHAAGTHIRSIGVNSAYQSSGIGSKLMKLVLNQQSRPITLNIDVNWHKEKLAAYYTKFGFKFSGKHAPNGNEVWILN